MNVQLIEMIGFRMEVFFHIINNYNFTAGYE